MQKNLLTQLAALLFCGTAFTQIKITNRDAMHPDSSLLFIGATNNIAVSGQEPEYDLTVKSGTASISKAGANSFFVTVHNEHPVTLQAVSNKGRQVVYSRQFKSELLLPYEIRIAGSEDTAITTGHIIANPVLAVIIPKSQYKHFMSVTSFRLSIISGGDTLLAEDRQVGNRLTTAQLEQIRKLSKGDKLYFDEIRATSPDSRSIKFPPLTILIR
ncbi:MAG: hypothetical protein DI535_06215 [Citrobacter freundii]|nr:MAG: hypothetical protein DI535_06215 [Citrobacter freundii]